MQRAAWTYVKAGAAFLLLLFMLLVLVALMGAFVPLHGQMVSVKDFPGTTVGDKLTNAQNLGCSPDTAVTCVLVLDPVLSVFSTGTLPARCSRCTWLDYTAKGVLTVTGINSIRFADQFPGADCGAKINSADADLGSSAGEIWVNRRCGITWTTPVILGTNHSLHFSEGATYLISATITLGQASSMIGLPQGVYATLGAAGGPVTLKQADNSNRDPFISITGSQASLRDVTIDCNGTNNPAMGPYCVKVTGQRFLLTGTSVINAKQHNLAFISTGSNNEAASPNLSHGMLLGANLSGLYCENTTDGFIGDGFESENNGRDGYELHNCSGWRFGLGDSGGNARYGISQDGRSDYWSGGGMLISPAFEFGNNGQGDVYIQGKCTNTSATCAKWNVISGKYNGLINTAPDGIYDAIHIENGVENIISPVVIRSLPGHRYKYGVHVLDSGGQVSTGNVLGSFVCGDAGASAACVQDDSVQGLSSSYLLNNHWLQWVDSTGVATNVLNLGADNNLYINVKLGKSLIIQNGPSNNALAVADGGIVPGGGGGKTFAMLGSPPNGTIIYCSDCTIANPCASGGTGALAKRLNGAWVCN